MTGTAPTADKHLGGKVQIGLDPAGPTATAVVGTVLGSTNTSYGVTQADYAGHRRVRADDRVNRGRAERSHHDGHRGRE